MQRPTELVAAILSSLLATPALAAQDAPPAEQANAPSAPQASATSPDDAESLAKKLSNPVASLISVPFQANLDFGVGLTDSGDKMTLNIQPVVPIGITQNANLIVRTIVPVIFQTDLRGDDVSDFGLGDTVQSFFYSPKKPTAGGIIWGAGPVFLYPSGTSKYTTSDKWGAGPTFVVLKQFGPTTIGLLANHIWSVAGSDARPDVSSTFLQPFLAYTTKRATTYGLNTESTYDWKTKQWSVPINVTVAQLVRIGRQPVSFTLGGRYYVARPKFGPDWGVRFVTTLLFPK
ncbi:hypothetical protein LVY65_09140 [Sphingomonas sp. G124]|uniref:Transporter n=1 Tax=Sphingomonas cremea TaxID=2904799 RepID=A0A9X1QPR2_9SPHN|nr:hypothetical protein [Sphingomonas cremea]MCF2515224.1 hypothetical protein [Sphingomonas cremea]